MSIDLRLSGLVGYGIATLLLAAALAAALSLTPRSWMDNSGEF